MSMLPPYWIYEPTFLPVFVLFLGLRVLAWLKISLPLLLGGSQASDFVVFHFTVYFVDNISEFVFPHLLLIHLAFFPVQSFHNFVFLIILYDVVDTSESLYGLTFMELALSMIEYCPRLTLNNIVNY